MPEDDYVLRIRLETTGRLDASLGGAMSRAYGLDMALRSVGSGLASIGGKITGAFTGAVERVGELTAKIAGVGAVAAFGALTYATATWNQELETAKIGIGAVFGAQGFTKNLEEGMSLAQAAMQQIRDDAKLLPVTFREARDVFQGIVTQAGLAGMSVGQIVQMTDRLTAVGKAVMPGYGTEVIGREAAMLLAGHAGARNVLGARLGLMGASAKTFNAMDAEKRAEELMKRLNNPSFTAAIQEYGRSFIGLSTTLKDNVLRFLEPATMPLFNRIKSTLSSLNQWFSGHKDDIQYWANTIGYHLGNAWKKGTDAIKEWLPAIEKFATDAYSRIVGIWQRIAPTISAVAGTLKESLLNGSALNRIEGILKLYAGVKIASGAAGFLGPAVRAVGGMANMAFIGAGGGAAGGEAAMSALGGAAALAIPAIVGVGIAATAVGGQFMALADVESKYHAAAVEAQSRLDNAFSTLSANISQFYEESGFHDFIEMVGVNATAALAGLVEAINDATSWLRRKFGLEEVRPMKEFIRDEQSALVFHVKRTSDMLAKATKGLGGGAGGTNIQKVEITVSSNADPSRVARLVFSELENIARHPRSSRNVVNWSSSRI